MNKESAGMFPYTTEPNPVTSKVLANEFTFKVPSTIEGIEDLEPLIELCEMATENDTIKVDIFCYGGCMDSCKAAYNAMRGTAAHVHTINRAVAYSGGAILLTAGDAISIMPFATTMFHTASYGVYPDKAPEVKTKVDATDKDIKNFYNKICAGLLTQEEIDNILKGVPLYIYDDEHQEYLERFAEYRKEEYEKAQAEYETQQMEALGIEEPLSEEAMQRMTKKQLIAYIQGEDE